MTEKEMVQSCKCGFCNGTGTMEVYNGLQNDDEDTSILPCVACGGTGCARNTGD